MNSIDTKIQAMRAGGKILHRILQELKGMIKPGLDAYDLEIRFRELCTAAKVLPSCLGYRASNWPPFPTGLCIGINDDSVHCYPKKGTILKEGDLITVDTVIKHNGYHVDSAFTAGVGTISAADKKFIETVEFTASRAYQQALVGNRIGAIGNTMESILKLGGYNVLEDFVGHGIGTNMHELPDIPCFGPENSGPKIVPGMTLAIETLACQGAPEISYPDSNDWQTKLADGRKFAIFEHTVLVTENGPEILTN